MMIPRRKGQRMLDRLAIVVECLETGRRPPMFVNKRRHRTSGAHPSAQQGEKSGKKQSGGKKKKK